VPLGEAMRRRDFIKVIAGSATVWPLAARTQQPTKPVIGFLGDGSQESDAIRVNSFREGLNQSGFAEGQNVALEYLWAEGQHALLPELAAEFVHRNVAAIITGSTPGALAAKAATKSIPIIFYLGTDPVALGLIASLNRPGGNLTGVSNLSVMLVPKQLQLMHELVPTATVIGLLLNPTSPVLAEPQSRDAQAAARALGIQLHVLRASTDNDFDAVFATLTELQAAALVIGTDAFFAETSRKLGELTLHHAIPAIYQYREFAAAGGLMSYGTSLVDAYRQVGTYAGRVLHGDQPAVLPVQQVVKLELIINLKTAKALNLTIPLPILGRADEVIE
jgi:putative tryptophan/tyrosine transport system substrate-binding protein